jgi:hypothetical protein
MKSKDLNRIQLVELFYFSEGTAGTTTTTSTAVPMTTSHMYLVITTAIWMNKTSSRPSMRTAGQAQNVPFAVLGVMLPYKTVRSTHFSNLCVRISKRLIRKEEENIFFQAKMDTGICYIIDENGYIMFISQPEGQDRTVDPIVFNFA